MVRVASPKFGHHRHRIPFEAGSTKILVGHGGWFGGCHRRCAAATQAHKPVCTAIDGRVFASPSPVGETGGDDPPTRLENTDR